MDLRSHLVAYRSHLSKTSLSGCEAYAKLVRTKDNTATAAEYLSYFRNQAQDAASEMNSSKYASALRSHQVGMLSLYEKMLEDDLLGFDRVSEESVLDLIAFRGWNWFRHVPKVIEATYDLGEYGRIRVGIVPHYGERYRKLLGKYDAVFDAEEMAHLSARKKEGLLLRVLLEKKKKPRMKFFENGTFRPADQNNTASELVDWALPLGI